MKTIAQELPEDGQLCRVVTENSEEFTAIFSRSLFDATMWDFSHHRGTVGVSRTVMLSDRWEPAIQLVEKTPMLGQACTVFSEIWGQFNATFAEDKDVQFWNLGSSRRLVSHNDKWFPRPTEKPTEKPTGCNDYGLTKYDRPIKGAKQGTIDVYAVIETFNVTCPARQHALKKLLCSGIRGKGDALQDLKETRVAIDRAIALQEERNANG